MNIGDRVIGTGLNGVKYIGVLIYQEPPNYDGDWPYLVRTTSKRKTWCVSITPLKTTLLKEYFKFKQ